MSNFCLNDYDCIGFDLDHTLARYHLPNTFQLTVQTLTEFLVEVKGYSSDLLLEKRTCDRDFLQKGILLDIKKGNLLKIGGTGVILRATHGTKMLSKVDISQIYGPQRLFPGFERFQRHMNEGRGKLGKEYRSFRDHFDMPCALVSARLVDLIDRDEKSTTEDDNYVYSFWPDILAGLIYMFGINNFPDNTGGFFPALKQNISNYVMECSTQVKSWLKKMRRAGKIVFMVTGSNYDYATFLSAHCLGNDWRDYFDIVVTFAGKPGFFSGYHDFWYPNGETVLSHSDLKRGGLYRRGNYTGLLELFTQLTDIDDPRVVYFGDNLVQDVFTPAKYCRCDTVAVVEEIENENKRSKSMKWGSFFHDDEVGTLKDGTGINTMFAHVVLTHSKIAIPSLDALAGLPLHNRINAFYSNGSTFQSGFYPTDPESLATL